MRKLNEQWAELSMMYKATAGNCSTCYWGDNGGCTLLTCPVNNRDTDLHVKSLGVVNHNGCLPEERTGVYPEIRISGRTWVCELCIDDLAVSVYGRTKQEVIDRWNRRA